MYHCIYPNVRKDPPSQLVLYAVKQSKTMLMLE